MLAEAQAPAQLPPDPLSMSEAQLARMRCDLQAKRALLIEIRQLQRECDRLGREIALDEHERMPPKAILAAVARETGVKVQLIRGRNRVANVVRARHLAVFMIRSLSAASYPQIGRLLGGRDHAAIIHADQSITRAITRDADLWRRVAAIERSLDPRADRISSHD